MKRFFVRRTDGNVTVDAYNGFDLESAATVFHNLDADIKQEFKFLYSENDEEPTRLSYPDYCRVLGFFIKIYEAEQQLVSKDIDALADSLLDYDEVN